MTECKKGFDLAQKIYDEEIFGFDRKTQKHAASELINLDFDVFVDAYVPIGTNYKTAKAAYKYIKEILDMEFNFVFITECDTGYNYLEAR
jgi:hypothetical protein